MKLKTITQEIFFPNVNAATLFELYTNQAKHIEVTRAPAIITDKLGEPFNLYNGFCFGENIELKKNRLIIQSWRTDKWPDGVDDSIVVIRLIEEGKDTYLYLTHADLPEEMAESLSNGWKEFYWDKWKNYLAIKSESINN
ncbi:MAG: SRPBCC domain-containing protein [Ferruginibacter sp.]